jgi:type IV pilus assembly protein PilA
MHKGFTIIELLVVIAIIGVVAALGAGAWMREVSVGQIREDQTRLATTLERARSASRRWSYDIVCSSTTTTLQCQAQDRAGNTQAVFSQTATLLYSRLTNPAVTFTFQAPFGRISSQETLALESSAFTTQIDLIGVTGLVIRRALTAR